MIALLKEWWRVERDYRASMKALRRMVKERGREIHRAVRENK